MRNFAFGSIFLATLLLVACQMNRDATAGIPTPESSPATTSIEKPAAPASVVDVKADAVVPINDRHYAPGVMALIDSARQSIQVCLYQVRFYDEYPGSLSNRMIDKLILAKRRGVDVQVIIDSSPWKEQGVFDEQNQASAARLVQGGCSVSLDPGTVQSHQKIMIVDGTVAVVASANWSHYSLSSNREVAVAIWSADLAGSYGAYFAACQRVATPFVAPDAEGDLELQGEVVPYDHLVTPAELAKQEDTMVASDAIVTTLNNRDYYTRLRIALDAAKTSIKVVQDYAYVYAVTPQGDTPPPPSATPRVAPSETNLIFDDLLAAHRRDIDVRIIFDYSEYDDGGIQFSGEDFANRLGALGVPVYHDGPTSRIHAKMLLIDGNSVVVGSTNWSHQALEENNECSVLIRSESLGEFYKKWVDSVFERSYLVVMPIEKHETKSKPVVPAFVTPAP